MEPMSANGCTTAPGPLGAHNCVVVNGSGTRVESAYSQYYYTQPIGSNVCDRKHQFSYTGANGTVYQPIYTAGGCVNPAAMIVTGDYVKIGPLNLKANTGFCTRVNNTGTDHRWSSWACITIKA